MATSASVARGRRPRRSRLPPGDAAAQYGQVLPVPVKWHLPQPSQQLSHPHWFPHAPLLWLSLLRSCVLPSLHVWRFGAMHAPAVAQVPATQEPGMNVVGFGGHIVVQLPQWKGSACRFAQTPPQFV
jgi:hypothetical protein